MIKIPQSSIWKQNNFSDLFGDIWSSFNIDLSARRGKVATNRMLTVARGIDDDTNTYVASMGLAVAFRFYNGVYYAAAGSDSGSRMSRVSPFRTNTWSLDVTTDAPTKISDRYSDMEIFNERLYVTQNNTKLARNDSGTWLNGEITITDAVSSRPRMMTSYAKRLYCTIDYAKINSMAANEVFPSMGASNTLDLENPTSNTITFLRATSSRIWIGTVNRNGGKAKIYAWDGDQNSVNETYKLQSSGAMSAVVKDDVLYVIDNDGRLLAFNGGTFVEIDRLPIKQGEYLFFPLGEYNNRWIHPNGMTVQDDRILILIDNEYRGSSVTSEENVSSGIWEWTQETGLYHKYAFSNHNATSGSLTDYGQNRISIAGALSSIKSSSDNAADNGTLLSGVQLFSDASTIENHIQIDDYNNTIEKYGYLITPKIFSQNITPKIFSQNIDDTWQKFFLRFKKLASTDEIVVKYRTEDIDPLDIAITTWSGSNSVRTTTDISDYSVGDEIEFLQGDGAGKCFHIKTIIDLGGSVTEITLDESFEGLSGDSGKARLQKWKKVGVVFKDTNKDILEKPLLDAKSSMWIQFKVTIQNTGDSYIYDILVANKFNQKIQ